MFIYFKAVLKFSFNEFNATFSHGLFLSSLSVCRKSSDRADLMSFSNSRRFFLHNSDTKHGCIARLGVAPRYCWKCLTDIKQLFLFFFNIYIIFLTRRNLSETLYQGQQLSYFPDLLSET